MTLEECYNVIIIETSKMLEGHIYRTTEPPTIDLVGVLTIVCGCVAIGQFLAKAIWLYENGQIKSKD